MVALAKEPASYEPATSGVVGELGGFAYEAQSPWTLRANPLPLGHSRSACGSRLFVFGTYLDEVLMMRNAAGTKYYYHTNHLYSVHAITNQSGAIVEAVGSYDAYGKPTILTGAGTDATWFTGDDVVGTVSAIGNPWWWESQRLDTETGLGYFKTRYWNYADGRFLSRNPWGYIQNRSNLYEFAWSRPTVAVEPYSPGSIFLLETPSTINPLIGTTRTGTNVFRQMPDYGRSIVRPPNSNIIGDPIPAPTGPSVPTVPTLYPPAPFDFLPPHPRWGEAEPSPENDTGTKSWGEPVEESTTEDCQRKKRKDVHCCHYRLELNCEWKDGKSYKQLSTLLNQLVTEEVMEDQPCRQFPSGSGFRLHISHYKNALDFSPSMYEFYLRKDARCRIQFNHKYHRRTFGPCKKPLVPPPQQGGHTMV